MLELEFVNCHTTNLVQITRNLDMNIESLVKAGCRQKYPQQGWKIPQGSYPQVYFHRIILHNDGVMAYSDIPYS